MVDYSGSNEIELGNDDVFDEDINVETIGFPTVLPGDMFPEKPDLTNPKAAEYFLPFLLDEESYLKKYASPTMTDEQIEKAYAPSDWKSQRNLALSKFGFGLLQPTLGGKIGGPLSQAGSQLTNDLMQIKQEQIKESKTNQIGKINAKIKRDAQKILERKGIFDANRTLLTTIAGKDYDAAIASDKALMQLYTDQMKSAQAKFGDYQLKGIEPKRVQVRQKDVEGNLSDPFDAFVVQSIQEDGSLSAPQYYRPTNVPGPDGLPQMELIKNPEGIIEVKTTITGTPDDFSSKSGVTKYLDVLSSLQTKDRALITLDLMRESFSDKPSRAGLLAGIQKRFQTYAQIFSDSYNYQFNNFFEDEYKDEYTGANKKKFQNLSSTIELYLQDPSIQEDLKNGVIDQADLDALQTANKAFDQLGTVGRAELLAHARGGKDKYGIELFESEEEKQKIYNKLRFFDTELPANEVRANAIIYAIARARKSSGRLNLDDIERAAKDLNIYGDSSTDVLVKINELRRQLLGSRADDLAQIQLVFPKYYERMIEGGYGSYNRDNTNQLIIDVNSSVDTPKVEFNFNILEDGSVKQN